MWYVAALLSVFVFVFLFFGRGCGGVRGGVGGVFSVMLWVANGGGQISDGCCKVSIVPSISVLQLGLRSLCPHVILLMSLLSCFSPLCPQVSFFFLFVQPQGQVVLGSSKPFFCSAAPDFILFWFSAHSTTGLKLYFALFTAHCWAVFATPPPWCPAPSQ